MTNRFSTLFLIMAMGIALPGMQAVGQETADAEQAELTRKAQDQILEELKAAGQESYRTLADKPELTRKILIWKFRTQVSPGRLAQLVQGREPLARANFLNDVGWLYGFVNSGVVRNADKALDNLSMLCSKDPAIATNSLYKRMATAAALEFAKNIDPKKPDDKSDWNDPELLWKRYQYYRSSYDHGLLNPQFAKLDYWDMRIIMKAPPRGWGAVESLTWQRDNVRLPAQNYTGACWQAPYRRYNQIGEIIHGKEYYVPFRGVYSCEAEMVKDVGAVCGGLSTFGAHAAIANGVPAMTMGEPGHCAYTVRTTMTNWVPAYSLSWKRSTHMETYGKKWAHLILYQDNFSDKQRFAEASKLRWMAELAGQAGEKDMVRGLYQQALIAQPRNYTNWRNYLDWEKEQDALTMEQWSNLNSQVCKTFGPEYPELCWELLSQKIYPKLFSYELTGRQKLDEVMKYHHSIEKMEPAQWDYPAILDYQFGYLGHEELAPFVDRLVSRHLASGSYGGATLSWCYSQMSGDPALKKRFFEIVAGNSKQGEGAEGALASLAGSIILDAAKNEDIGSFQAAGQLIKDRFKPKLPKFERFPGELLSSGGLLKLSSVHNRWGAPWQHWGVLEECGGDFHTKDDDPVTATVMLPRIGIVKGIVVIPRSANLRRGNNSVIEVSMDGQNWTQIAKIDKMKRVTRLDLKGNDAKAKYVRISRAGKDCYHLEAFLIYGERAS